VQDGRVQVVDVERLVHGKPILFYCSVWLGASATSSGSGG
jgi:hypothetical protein